MYHAHKINNINLKIANILGRTKRGAKLLTAMYVATEIPLTATKKFVIARRIVPTEQTTSNVRTEKGLDTSIAEVATVSAGEDAMEKFNVQMEKMRRVVEVIFEFYK